MRLSAAVCLADLLAIKAQYTYTQKKLDWAS